MNVERNHTVIGRRHKFLDATDIIVAARAPSRWRRVDARLLRFRPMQTFRTHGLNRDDELQLERALNLLGRHAPDVGSHVAAVFHMFVFTTSACGPNALACVRPDSPGIAFLQRRPSQLPTLEVALDVGHEAFHISLADGLYRFVPHTCVDCGDPRQRARDAIYQREELLRIRLVAGMRNDAAAQAVASTRPWFAPSEPWFAARAWGRSPFPATGIFATR